MSNSVEDDPLLALVSALPRVAAPDAAALRVRTRAHAALSRQRGRRQLRDRRVRSVMTGAVAAVLGSYVGSAFIQALQLYRLVW
jgi:hypothetical protein